MSQAITCGPLSVASHVRTCECGGCVVLLDLRHSRYLGLGQAASSALAGRVSGWPATVDPKINGSFDGLVSQLVSRGLLTSGFSNQAIEAALDEVAATFPGMELTAERGSADMGRTLRFARSVLIAAWGIRCRSLQSIAHSITLRRQKLQHPQADSIDAMRPDLIAYEALRPFVFTAREKCLLDSLALVTFLADEALLPQLVIGVRVNPFAAHAWVQSGCTVLNDQHEYVRRFRPILVV